MTSFVFETLLDEINTSFKQDQMDVQKIEDFLNKQFGQCIEINVVRYHNNKLTRLASFTQAHPVANEYICNSVQRILVDFEPTLAKEILKQLNINPERFLSFQQPLKQSKNTILVLGIGSWTKLPIEQLRFIYFFNQFLELEAQCYKLLKEAVRTCNEKQLAQTIKRIQRTLLTWSIDVIQLFHFDKSKQPKTVNRYDQKTLFTLGYDCLENILVHLERYYSKYIDRDLFVPFNVISSRLNCLKPRVERLKLMIVNQQYDSELLNALFEPLLFISKSSSKQRITYHQLMFIECYTNKLIQFYSKENKKENNIELLDRCLIELNYNNPAYLRYLSLKFSVKLNKQQSVESKLITLYSLLKSINQLISSTEVQYDRYGVNIKCWLIHWLEEEIWYLKSTCPIQISQENQIQINSIQKEKIQMNCPVNELALLTRMFSETDLINTKTHRELMELVSNNFQTSKVQEISIKSLSNKYYEPDTNTINSVKEKLIQMLNKLNRL